MESRNITIRPATVADASFIAQVVAMGIGDEKALVNYCGVDYVSVLTAIAASEGTQYSWQNALVAEVDGLVAGAIIGYDGANLYKLRHGTLAIVMEKVGKVPTIVDETEPGEYYIDTLAVMPEFRGMGTGRTLIDTFCTKVFQQGHNCVGLIVEDKNTSAQALYNSLGFKRVGNRPFFGHVMHHLQFSVIKYLGNLLARYVSVMVASGTHSSRISRSAKRIAEAYGYDLRINMSLRNLTVMLCDVQNPSVHYTELIAVQPAPISLSNNADLSKLSWEVYDTKMPIHTFEEKFNAIISTPRYSHKVIALMASVASFGLCYLFNGNIWAMLLVFLSTWVSFHFKAFLTKKQVNNHFIILLTAITASLIASCGLFISPQTADVAVATSVLYLVPGVVFISGLIDVLEGFVLIGFSRLVNATLHTISLAIGLLITIAVMHIVI